MRRNVLPTLVALVGLAGCGTAQAATRGYSVTDFDKIHVEGPFDVRVHTGGAAAAKATAVPDALERLSIEVHDGTLVVKPLPGGWGGWPGGERGKVVVEVTARRIDAAVLAGSGNVTIDAVRGDALDLRLGGSGDLSVGAIQVGRLNAVVAGSGDLTVAGRAGSAQASVSGSGDIHGETLVADAADVSLVGSGDIVLGARRAAKVSLTGSGDVDIKGPAACSVKKVGSGDVTCANRAKEDD